MPVVATQTCRVSGTRALVVKGGLYAEDDPVVQAHPWLFDRPEDAARKASPPKTTAELGERAMSTPRRKNVEQATAEPGEQRDVDTVCDVCGFEAKNGRGLSRHKATHDA
jgi:hypothetical protein